MDKVSSRYATMGQILSLWNLLEKRKLKIAVSNLKHKESVGFKIRVKVVYKVYIKFDTKWLGVRVIDRKWY